MSVLPQLMDIGIRYEDFLLDCVGCVLNSLKGTWLYLIQQLRKQKKNVLREWKTIMTSLIEECSKSTAPKGGAEDAMEFSSSK